MYSYIFSNNNMEIRVFIIDQIEFMAKIKIGFLSANIYSTITTAFWLVHLNIALDKY